jgi:hypothetical protein
MSYQHTVEQPFKNLTIMASFEESTNPEWPMNVMVFHPTDNVQGIKDKSNQLKTQRNHTICLLKRTENDPYANIPDLNDDGNQKAGTTYTSEKHFSTMYYALLFAPGE